VDVLEHFGDALCSQFFGSYWRSGIEQKRSSNHKI